MEYPSGRLAVRRRQAGTAGLGFAFCGAHEPRPNAIHGRKAFRGYEWQKTIVTGFERGLLTSGNQQANAQEMLAELVRLVESSRLAPEGSAPTARTAPEPTRADMEPAPPLEITPPQPLVEVWSSKPSETAAVVVDTPRARKSDNSYSNDPNGIDVARGRRSGARTFKALALVLAGWPELARSSGLNGSNRDRQRQDRSSPLRRTRPQCGRNAI